MWLAAVECKCRLFAKGCGFFVLKVCEEFQTRSSLFSRDRAVYWPLHSSNTVIGSVK